MNRLLVLIAASLSGVLLLCSAAQATAVSAVLQQRIETAGPGDKVPVIVHFADRVDLKSFAPRSDRAAARAGMVRGMRDQARRSQGSLQGFLRQRGAEPAELWLINALAVQVPPALVATLAAWPGVAAVELDAQIAPPAPVTLAVPAEPTDNIAAIGVEPLWAAGFTGLGVVVASFDSGVDVTHRDLTTRYRGGTNDWFDPYTDSTTPYDVDGHGTATTSLMVGGAARGNTIGVAPDAQWIAAKIFPDTGDAVSSRIIESFQWALNPDDNLNTDDAPDVINNSWGFEDNLNQCITNIVHEDISLPLAIQAVQDFGIHVVFSAGNSGPAAATSVSPANYPGGLAVGSINLTNYAVSCFSARGPSACRGSIYTDLTVDVYPEIVAPGESILVAYPVGVITSGYAIASGTSFSAPHVSGALALLRSAVPAATPAEIEEALLMTSADLGPLGADNSYGRGLVDLPAAYARLTGQPHLSIYAPAAPENDDQLDFGSVTPGTVKVLEFVLKNNGGADRAINLISNDLLAPELVLVDNTCPATLSPGEQCTLEVRFAPVAFVRSSGQLIINSDDSQQPQRILAVTGFGNTLPPPAQLLAPTNNAVDLASSVNLSWIQEADGDDDALTMTLFVDNNACFSSRNLLVFPNLLPAVMGVVPAALAIFLLGPFRNRRRLLLAAAMLTSLCIAFACGGGGGTTVEPTVEPTESIVVNNLSPDTIYYWKVRTVDSRGGVSESAVRSFRTR